MLFTAFEILFWKVCLLFLFNRDKRINFNEYLKDFLLSSFKSLKFSLNYVNRIPWILPDMNLASKTHEDPRSSRLIKLFQCKRFRTFEADLFSEKERLLESRSASSKERGRVWTERRKKRGRKDYARGEFNFFRSVELKSKQNLPVINSQLKHPNEMGLKSPVPPTTPNFMGL